MAGEIILYNTEDGSAALQLRAHNGSVWLTQAEMAELFQTSVSNINKPIKGIIAEGEQPPATIELYSRVQAEEQQTIERQVARYGLVRAWYRLNRYFTEALSRAKALEKGVKRK